MLFSFSETLKEIKKAVSVTAVNPDGFKAWVKDYERVSKQMNGTYDSYTHAKSSLLEVEQLLVELEALLKEYASKDESAWDKEQRNRVHELGKQLKQRLGRQTHDFLVDEENSEYHSIYQCIVSESNTFQGEAPRRIMLLSEVENLLAMIREIKGRRRPNLNHLAYQYTYGKVKNLKELPYQDKLQHLQQVYLSDFYEPIERILIAEGERAGEMLELGITGFGAAKKQEALGIWGLDVDSTVGERVSVLLKEVR